MIRLNKLTDYAVIVLRILVLSDGDKKPLSSLFISSRTSLPEPTVAKILKRLTREGLVQSHRGLRGGYRMCLRAEDISIGRIIKAMEGPVSLTECVDGQNCDRHDGCGLFGRWDRVNQAIDRLLDDLTLANLLEDEAETIPDFTRAAHNYDPKRQEICS